LFEEVGGGGSKRCTFHFIQVKAGVSALSNEELERFIDMVENERSKTTSSMCYQFENIFPRHLQTDIKFYLVCTRNLTPIQTTKIDAKGIKLMRGKDFPWPEHVINYARHHNLLHHLGL
jgi:hypothetical protein